jgi:hypothetical protein
MGDPSVDVTDEKRDEAQIAKSKAMEAMADGICYLLMMHGYFGCVLFQKCY